MKEGINHPAPATREPLAIDQSPAGESAPPNTFNRLLTTDAVSGQFDTRMFPEAGNRSEYLERSNERILSPELVNFNEIKSWLDENVWSFEDFQLFKKLFKKGIIFIEESGDLGLDEEQLKMPQPIVRGYSKWGVIDMLSKYAVLCPETRAELKESASHKGAFGMRRIYQYF